MRSKIWNQHSIRFLRDGTTFQISFESKQSIKDEVFLALNKLGSCNPKRLLLWLPAASFKFKLKKFSTKIFDLLKFKRSNYPTNNLNSSLPGAFGVWRINFTPNSQSISPQCQIIRTISILQDFSELIFPFEHVASLTAISDHPFQINYLRALATEWLPLVVFLLNEFYLFIYLFMMRRSVIK